MSCFFDEITMLTPKCKGRLKVFGGLFDFSSINLRMYMLLEYCPLSLSCHFVLLLYLFIATNREQGERKR